MEEKKDMKNDLSNNNDAANDLNIETSCCNDDTTYMHIKVESGEHKYYFKIPEGTTIGRAYDAAFSVLNKIAELTKEAIENLKVKTKESSNGLEENGLSNNIKNDDLSTENLVKEE